MVTCQPSSPKSLPVSTASVFSLEFDFIWRWKLTASSKLGLVGPHVPFIDWTKLVVKNKCAWMHWCPDMVRMSKYNYVCGSIERCYTDSSSFIRKIFFSLCSPEQLIQLWKSAHFLTLTWGWRNNLPATLFEPFCHCSSHASALLPWSPIDSALKQPQCQTSCFEQHSRCFRAWYTEAVQWEQPFHAESPQEEMQAWWILSR